MFKNISKRERFLIVFSLILSFTLIVNGGTLSEVSARDNSNNKLFQELKIFTDVLALVQRDYVDDMDSNKLVEGSIKGLLATLDPHSGYLDPDYYQDLQVQTKGEFGGLGIEIGLRDGLLVVVAPMEGSPAELAGIRAGDTIIKIEDQFTKDFSLVDAVKTLRGPKGEPVTISIHREGHSELIDVRIVRDNILVKSVRSRYLGDGVGYVRINQFLESTAKDLKQALAKVKRENGNKDLSGLIIDVRNNPGGLLTQAVQVTDLFISEGVIVYTDGRVKNQKQQFFARNRGTEPSYPIAVLVNGGSASASEILAGAIKDHGRGVVLGTKTFGKGSVQTITPLENGGALTLTTALYYTKSGTPIQKAGIEPDIEVENDPYIPPVAATRGKDETPHILENLPEGAVENFQESSLEDEEGTTSAQITARPLINPEVTPLEEWMELDRQFKKAVNLMKNFDVITVSSSAEKVALNPAYAGY